MAADTSERGVQRQLLLTRIAVERVELLGDLERLRRSANVSRLLRRALAPSPLLGALFGVGAHRKPGAAGWAATAVDLWRRWRRVAPLFALLAPLLRGRRWLRLPLLGGAVVAGLWAVKRRGR